MTLKEILKSSFEPMTTEDDTHFGFDIDKALSAIYDHLISILPEEKQRKECDCVAYENCGCKVDDFNAYRNLLIKKIKEEKGE